MKTVSAKRVGRRRRRVQTRTTRLTLPPLQARDNSLHQPPTQPASLCRSLASLRFFVFLPGSQRESCVAPIFFSPAPPTLANKANPRRARHDDPGCCFMHHHHRSSHTLVQYLRYEFHYMNKNATNTTRGKKKLNKERQHVQQPQLKINAHGEPHPAGVERPQIRRRQQKRSAPPTNISNAQQAPLCVASRAGLVKQSVCATPLVNQLVSGARLVNQSVTNRVRTLVSKWNSVTKLVSKWSQVTKLVSY